MLCLPSPEGSTPRGREVLRKAPEGLDALLTPAPDRTCEGAPAPAGACVRRGSGLAPWKAAEVGRCMLGCMGALGC